METARWTRLYERARPFLPWLSLATGVGGAVLMTRTPGRAWLVVVAAVAGWIALVAFNVVERVWKEAPPTTARARGARFALVLSNQMAVQQALLFPLPFYVRAAHLPHVQPEHLAFFVAYAMCLVVVLWDPLFQRALTSVLPAFALQAFSVFVGLDMVLPVLGLSNELSLVVAGAATAVGVPLAMLLTRSTAASAHKWRDRALAAVGAVVVVVLARLAAPLVPPAPLELVSVAIGTGVEERELTGAADVIEAGGGGELFCHSAIKAPLGLKDGLFHVWRLEGHALEPVRLDVKGGREAGFRTWSKEPARAGRWTCTVETSSGQLLGSAAVLVK